MLVGFALFWVGAVLCLNGIWLLGKIGDREIAVIDVFVGFVTLLVALYLAFGPGANAATIKAAALLLLFTFTYFWVAWNRWNGADGRGLGWFCLFVAITCVPVFLETLANAHSVWDVWLGISWASWGVLWFLFFLILALGRTNLTRVTGILCSLQGVYTGWIPGYLLLSGTMPGGPPTT
jgi:putative amide transporter protein